MGAYSQAVEHGWSEKVCAMVKAFFFKNNRKFIHWLVVFNQ